MEKLGVERRAYTAGENKDFLDPFAPENPAHKEHAQKMLEEIHQQFIKVVREGRGKRLKESPEIFSGPRLDRRARGASWGSPTATAASNRSRAT